MCLSQRDSFLSLHLSYLSLADLMGRNGEEEEEEGGGGEEEGEEGEEEEEPVQYFSSLIQLKES